MVTGIGAFALALFLGWREGWDTTGLVWGIWLAGLVTGFCVLSIGCFGQWRRTRERWRPWVRVLVVLFQMLRFIGLYWIVEALLPMAFELEIAAPGVFAASFWIDLWSAYWPVVLLTFACEFDTLRAALHRFDEITPFLNLARILITIIPATWLGLAGYFSGLFTIDGFFGYTLVALLFFSPWRIGHSLEPAIESKT